MNYFVALGVFLFCYMTSWYVVALIKKRNDVADIAWGLGFVLLAWASFMFSELAGMRAFLINSLVTIWGCRLAWHIYRRNKGKTEDYRYQEWRKSWGKWFYLRSFLQVFFLQGIFLYCIVFPVLLINRAGGGAITVFDIIGAIIWLIGFSFESIGDAQLARFISDPVNKGKLMREGLWHYTRHPNYFGEVLQWWGIWIVALSVPYGWVGMIGPLTITILILKVSGIPLLEKKMATNPEFESYRKETSVFIPWFPGK